MRNRILGLTLLATVIVAGAASFADEPLPRSFRWQAGEPILTSRAVDGFPWHSVKDPTIVRHDGRWHLFVTVRGSERSHAVVYLNFADWQDAEQAERHVLPMHDGFFCAPQVFYFTPHEKWYLICQAANEEWGEPPYRPAYSTTDDLSDPDSWTPLKPMFPNKPEGPKAWLDFWVICDESKAYLFFTSLDGKMHRSETSLEAFPTGWSQPVVALEGDIFEASHTYKLKGRDNYLTIIEAQHGHGWRYFKSYTADRLDGKWTPLTATKENAFASQKNVMQTGSHWTDSISHGELIRAGHDERLEVDVDDLQFVFQGVLEEDRRGKGYGDIPWRLGVLKQVEVENER